MTRAARIGWFAAAPLVCLVVFWRAPLNWFQNDDFAWLGLPLEVNRPADLLHVLFTPEAQGTVRVFSERVFFLTFSSLFGLHALPYHLWALATWLCGSDAGGPDRRAADGITGSRVARGGFVDHESERDHVRCAGRPVTTSSCARSAFCSRFTPGFDGSNRAVECWMAMEWVGLPGWVRRARNHRDVSGAGGAARIVPGAEEIPQHSAAVCSRCDLHCGALRFYSEAPRRLLRSYSRPTPADDSVQVLAVGAWADRSWAIGSGTDGASV